MSVADLTVPNAILPVLEDIDIDIDALRVTVADVTIEADTSAEMGVKISQALYEVFHAGRRSEEGEALPFHLRDREFERTLAEGVPHGTTVSEGVIAETVTADAADDSMVLVACGGPRVWIPRDRIATGPPFTAGQRVDVTLSPMRPALSPGFFFVHGSAPSDMRGHILRVYIHLAAAERAPAVWHRVLSHLEEREAEYRAKVLSSALLFPRRDGLVVYLGERSRGLAAELATLVTGMPGVGTETSAFAQALGPGVAVAWEPDDRRAAMRGMSFGQHRAGVIGQALVEAAVSKTSRATVIAARFAEANIDPCHPARNRTSPQAMTEGACMCPPLPDLERR